MSLFHLDMGCRQVAVTLMLPDLSGFGPLHRRSHVFWHMYRWSAGLGTTVPPFLVPAHRCLSTRKIDDFETAALLVLSRRDNRCRRATFVAMLIMMLRGDDAHWRTRRDDTNRRRRSDHDTLRRLVIMPAILMLSLVGLVVVIMYPDFPVLYMNGAYLHRGGMIVAHGDMLAAAQQGHGSQGECGNK